MSVRDVVQAAAGALGGAVNPNAWDISKAYFDPGPDAGDLSTSYRISPDDFSPASQDSTPRDVFFSPDGTKMYVIGNGTDSVYQYTLSVPWYLQSASYASKSYSVSSQETAPSGLFFNPDGDKMYVTGSSGDDVNQYSLSTAWDVSTASYVQNFSVSSQTTYPTQVCFNPDGTIMFVCDRTNHTVLHYGLSTAWDISTASYVQNFSVSSQAFEPEGLAFALSGTKMYVVGSTDKILEYTLSTAWDISTASYVQDSGTNPAYGGLYVKEDGILFFNAGTNGSSYKIRQTNTGGFYAPEDLSPTGLFFKPDGTKMYIVGSYSDEVNEYNLSTAWDVYTASYVQTFSVTTEEAFPEDLFFKPDGTKMYILGSNGDEVNEYNLSTAWDISTASYSQNFSVAGQEINPNGLFFKSDGTKMYVTGLAGDDVNEYNLSTAWDISTASYSQVFSVSSQQTQPEGICFDGDGINMYIIGYVNKDIDQYTLSTAWDVSTATYLQTFSVGAQNDLPMGIFFKPDGSQFFVAGDRLERILPYPISEE